MADNRQFTLRFLAVGFLVLNVVETVTIGSEDDNHHCIWYGVCTEDYFTYVQTNCAYNGPARRIEPFSQEILEKYCPEIAAGGLSCCDEYQISNMKRTLWTMKHILKNSSNPFCWDNFMKHICALICSPKQSQFLRPTRIEAFNETHDIILEVDYYLSEEYKNATFESCSKIQTQNDVTSESFPTFCVLFGAWDLSECTPERWFAAMGTGRTPLNFPNEINYSITNTEELTPYNPPTRQETTISTTTQRSNTENSYRRIVYSIATNKNDEITLSTTTYKNEETTTTEKRLLKSGCDNLNTQITSLINLLFFSVLTGTFV